VSNSTDRLQINVLVDPASVARIDKICAELDVLIAQFHRIQLAETAKDDARWREYQETPEMAALSATELGGRVADLLQKSPDARDPNGKVWLALHSLLHRAAYAPMSVIGEPPEEGKDDGRNGTNV
jgi:hypothetical protein